MSTLKIYISNQETPFLVSECLLVRKTLLKVEVFKFTLPRTFSPEPGSRRRPKICVTTCVSTSYTSHRMYYIIHSVHVYGSADCSRVKLLETAKDEGIASVASMRFASPTRFVYAARREGQPRSSRSISSLVLESPALVM